MSSIYGCTQPAENVEPLYISVKNSFLHVSDVDPQVANQNFELASCPAAISTETEKTKLQKQKEEEHRQGVCRPCVYSSKPDGCRQGNKCQFCHLCTPKDIRKRKKEKKIALRAAAAADGKAKVAPEQATAEK